MAQRYSQRPSQVLGIPNRFSAATAYDFDLAVMKLARVIEARSQETIETWETPPKPPVKGQVPVRKPKYTLAELLFEKVDGDGTGAPGEIDPAEDDALSHLPAALL